MSESIGETFKRLGISLATKAGEGFEDMLLGLPKALVGTPKLPSGKSIKTPMELIKEGANLKPEYLEPKNIGESYLHRMARFGPSNVIAGGGFPALGRSAIGAITPTLLKAAGAPEWAQDASQIITEAGAGRLAIGDNKWQPLSRIERSKKGAQALMHKTKTTPYPAEPIINAALNVEKRLGTEMNPSLVSDMRKSIVRLNDNLLSGKIDPKEALKIRKSLYRMGKKYSSSINADYINPLTKGINEYLGNAIIENPEFIKHVTARDAMHQMQKMGSHITDFLNSKSSGWLGKGAKLLARNLLPGIIPNTEKAFRIMAKKPSTWKSFGRLTGKGIIGDSSLYIKTIEDLYNRNKKSSETKSNIYIPKEGVDFKVVSRASDRKLPK